MWDVNHFDPADIKTMLTGHGGDLTGRTDQNWNNDAVLCAIHRAAQRTLVARMHDDGFGRRNALFARAISRSYFDPGACALGVSSRRPVGPLPPS
jgi:hypothetical protein